MNMGKANPTRRSRCKNCKGLTHPACMTATGVCLACRDYKIPTINAAGVSVYFPPEMFVHGADNWLAARGVPEACRWMCPTPVGDVATLRFSGGVR